MAEDFLFELGVEEMPAHVVVPSMNQLKERMEVFLKDNRLDYESIEAFSTPRRLAVRVNGLADKQVDIEEEAKGPAKKIALDENGEWSKAAQGFVRGQGATTEDIYFKELKGTEYVYVKKFIAGKTAMELLPNMIDDVVKKMTFPTLMHWGEHHLKFIRPIRWMVALLGDQIVPMTLLDVGSMNVSQGHRFLGAPVVIPNPKAYEMTLMKEYVMVESERRTTWIMEQMVDLATARQWKIDFDEDLLEEVANLVEYPTVFIGTFDEKYLDIPAEVLITSMKEHQRYFDVRDVNDNLLPYFIAVRNGVPENIEPVILGNEKVLTARLEDAEFFYREDQKVSIEENVAKLQHVTFHEKIGTMTEKMARVKTIATYLADIYHLSEEEKVAVQRAAEIYKFDLVTGMVGEFSELQGIMGEKYALLQGESQTVATAIREHYMPISADGDLPETKVGALLALADKLDSVMSFFTVGLVPSGSNDPYALRRQTYGMVRILKHFGWEFSMHEMFEKIQSLIASSDTYGLAYQVENKVLEDFFEARIKQWLQRQGVQHDVIEAVTHSAQMDVKTQIDNALMLQKHMQDDDLKASTESLNRVSNLAQKVEALIDIQVDLFEHKSEKALYEAYQKVAKQFNTQTAEENYMALKALQPIIDTYFNENMIMVDDEEVKQNRLSQLARIDQLVKQIAALDELVIK